MDAHVFNLVLVEKYEEIYADLERVQTRAMNKLIWQIYRREIPLFEFYKKAEALNLPSFKEKVFSGILRYDFFFIADYLNININDWLKYLSVEDLKSLKVADIESWVDKQAIESGVNLAGERKKRFISILSGLISGEKDEKQIIEMMIHSEKTGGLELSEENASDFVEDFKKWLAEAEKNQEIITTQKVALSVVSAVKSAVSASSPSSPASLPSQKTSPILQGQIVKQTAGQSQDNHSFIGELKSQSLKSQFVSASAPSVDVLEKKAMEIINKSGLSVSDDLKRRLQLIIISRLKEVRKISETKEKLIAGLAVGGMGFRADEADKLISLIELERGKPKASIVSPIAIAPLKPRMIDSYKEANLLPLAPAGLEKVVAPIIGEKAAAPAELEKVVAPIIEEKPSEKKEEKSLEERPKQPQPQSQLQSQLQSQPQPQLKNKLTPIPIRPWSANPPTTLDFVKNALPALKIERQKVTPIAAPPLPSKPPITNAIPQTFAGRDKVEDIAYKPRLMGPVEELAEMNLVDFRRLNPKPKVAVDKIFAKVELLAKEGYEKRIKGFQAWQRSPLNKMYNAILGISIAQGKKVSEVIAEKIKNQEFIMTEEEFKTIMELNRSMRI